MFRSHITVGLIVLVLSTTCVISGQQPTTTQPANQSSQTAAPDPNDPIVRIREEGLTRSHVLETLSYLSDVIGPRLTGSPNLKRANEWTRDQLTKWGLQNAHLES